MKRAMILLLVLVACSPARIAERKRAKAEALIKQAIETYPDIVQPVVRWDTITITTPSEAGGGEATYTQASMDSLVVLCSQLLTAERDKPPVKLTRYLCTFDTIRVDDGAVNLVIWPEGGAVKYWYYVMPQTVDTMVVSSSRTITAEPCPPVKAGYTRWQVVGFAGISAIMSFVIGVAFGLFSKGYIPPEQ